MNPTLPKSRVLIVLTALILAAAIVGLLLAAFNGHFDPVFAALTRGLKSFNTQVGDLTGQFAARLNLSAAAQQRWQANRLPATLTVMVLAGLVWMFRARRERVQAVMSGATLLPMFLTPVVELQQLTAFNQPRPVVQQADSTDLLATASAPALAEEPFSFTDLNTAPSPALDLTGFDQPDLQTVLRETSPAVERSIQTAAPSAVTAVSTFPYIQDFDSFSTCSTSTSHPACTLSEDWVNPTDDNFDWTVYADTPSSSTGPDEDHTDGNGKFLYTEAGNTSSGYVAHLVTPQFDLTGASFAQVSFWYHMYGSNMGTLHIDISTDGGSNWTTDLVTAWTDNTNSWQQKTIDLAAYYDETITLRFRNVLTGGDRGDMALDDFAMEVVTATPITTFPYNQLFSSFSNCSTATTHPPCTLSEDWINPLAGDDYDWIVDTGTDHGSGSTYLYTEASNTDSGDEVHLRTPQFDLAWAESATFSFWYDMDGSSMGTLHVDISTDSGNNWTTDIVTAWTDDDNGWQEKEIDLADYIGQTVTLRLRNVLDGGTDGDMKVDDFTMAVTYPDPIDTFPYTQDFESFATCDTNAAVSCLLDGVWWNLSDDDIDWIVDAGGTPTNSTGPSQDHNPGTASGNYLYTESTGSGWPNKVAHLVSPQFDLTGADVATLSFWYHMEGSSMGTMHLDVSTNNGSTWTTNIVSQLDVVTDGWQEKIIDLTAYAGQTIRLRVRGITGSGGYSDMAVDDFTVYDSNVSITKTLRPDLGDAGEFITYTLAYKNVSTSTVSGITLTDDVPAEFAVWGVTASPAVTDTGATPAYIWQLPDLAAGATGTLTVTGVVSGTGATFTNTATIADAEGADSYAVPFDFNYSFAQTYGGSESDYARSIQATSDGGYIVAGSTESDGAGDNDVWVLKLDSSGGVDWQKTYGGSASDVAFSVQETSDGGYIVAGYTESDGAGNADIWVLKLTSSGTVSWQKTYGGSLNDVAYSVQQIGSYYIVAGYTRSSGAGENDFWILKLTSTGSVSWKRIYGGSLVDIARSIQPTSDGGYIVAGETESFGAGSADKSDIWVIKLDSTGTRIWQKTYGGSADDVAYRALETSDGGYIVAGYTYSTGAGQNDAWVLKLDSDGAIDWQKTYGSSSYERAYSIQETGDGGYIVAGGNQSSGAGNSDFWVLKLDSSGAVSWQKTYGGSATDVALGIQETSDNGYIVAGFTESFGAGSTDKPDFWILKLDSTGSLGAGCAVQEADSAVVPATSSTSPATSSSTSTVTAVTPGTTTVVPANTTVTPAVTCGGAPALNLTKTVDDATPNAGERITYTLTLANTGATAISGAALFDSLPAGQTLAGPMTLTPADAGVVGDANTLPVLAHSLSIPAASNIELTLPVTVTVGGTQVNTAQAVAPGSTAAEEASRSITVNRFPTGGNNTIALSEDGDHTFSTNEFLYNDTDGDAMAGVKIVDLPASGSLTCDSTPMVAGGDCTVSAAVQDLVFTPDPDENGSPYATFTFRVKAATGAQYSNSIYTITLNVNPVSDAPEGANSAVGTLENVSYTFETADFIFSDADNDTLAGIQITQVESAGDLEYNGTDVGIGQTYADVTQLTFDPAPNAFGSPYSTFSYKLKDSSGTFSAAAYQLTINVTAVAEPPTGGNDTVTTPEDTTYTFQTSDFTFSDGDNDSFAGIELSFLETQGDLEYGGVDVVIGQTYADVTQLTFDPATNGNGSPYSSFNFHVRDSSGMTSTASYEMAITVTPVNDAPVGGDDSVTTSEDTAYTFSASDFTYSDSVEGDAFDGIRLTALESAGDLECDGADLTIGAECTDFFYYYESFEGTNGGWTSGGTNSTWARGVPADDVINSAADGAEAWVTNLSGDYNNNEDSYVQKSFDFSSLTTDPVIELDVWWEAENSYDGAKLQTTTDGGSTWTTVGALGDPNNWYTDDTINGLSWTDNQHGWTGRNGGGSDGWVTARHTLTGLAGEANAGLRIAFGADSTQTDNGFAFDNVQILGANQLVFTPDPNANGTPYATFQFKVRDAGGAVSTASYDMDINVSAVADRPTSAAASVSTPEDTAYTFETSDVTFNDPDGDDLGSIQVTELPTDGPLTYAGQPVTLNGVYADLTQLVYTPLADENGSPYDNFTFKVIDSTGLTSTVTYNMAINVSAVNDAPLGANDTVAATEDITYTFSGGDFTFSDIDGHTLAAIVIQTVETAGDLECSGSDVTILSTCAPANLRFIPAPDANGTPYASFTFKVQDSSGQNSAASYTLTINVAAVADTPVGGDGLVTLDANATYTFRTADFPYSDADGDAFAGISVVSTIISGTLTCNGTPVINGSLCSDVTQLDYTPAANESGEPYETYTFQVRDATAALSTPTYTMTINVQPGNPPTGGDSIMMKVFSCVRNRQPAHRR